VKEKKFRRVALGLALLIAGCGGAGRGTRSVETNGIQLGTSV